MNRTCPKCQSVSLIEKRFNSSLDIEGRQYPVEDLEYAECLNCGADPVLKEQARRNDLKFADVRRHAMGLLTADEIKIARLVINLNQKECSQLMGGGANSFHKYESGAVVQSIPMDLLIRVVRDVPGALTYVSKFRNMPVVAGQMELITVSPLAMKYSFSTIAEAVVGGFWGAKKADSAREKPVINAHAISYS